jgi:pimeloyl-ACP methyl ester carboxylesterase
VPFTETRPRLAYRLEGAAGPPVLLIMGFGMAGATWRPQLEGLRDAHRVVAYDHLGLGESEAAPALPTMRSMASDAERVLDALGWASAHVVGVSMGGMIAQELTLQAPGRVRSLTLIATHAGGVLASMPSAAGMLLFAQANMGPTSQRVEALKKLLYTPEFLASTDVGLLERRITDVAGKPAAQETLRGHLHAVTLHRAESRLGRVRAPTLVVRPGRDVLVAPRNSDLLAAAIPGARLLRFDDAGHGVTFQCAAALNRELARHVAAAEAPPPR